MRKALEKLCPALSAEQREKMDVYWRMLLEWNGRVNLTAITDTAEAAKKHFYDSLTALPYLQTGARCIDVGTGAGFPGLPLLIARPDLDMCLLDGLHKRVRFLEAVVAELGLKALCLHARAEDAGRDPAFRERFDAALSRAVAPLPVLLELTIPFLQVGGLAVCYKGEAAAEIERAAHALEALHCRLETQTLSSDYGRRTLLLARKTQRTAAAYPRRAGLPERRPL
ncbi:MAG: 16S rRNA (guanine(527)-N(7))-methyltransferase RsmG [Clostridia bacterium]|nr:16S rRNA (guanine(527)-N(7))-methyltransferase RsmG [Clostridia bacterium]